MRTSASKYLKVLFFFFSLGIQYPRAALEAKVAHLTLPSAKI